MNPLRNTTASRPVPPELNIASDALDDRPATKVDRALELRASRLALMNIVKDLDGKQCDLRQARDELAGLNATLESQVEKRTGQVRDLLAQKDGFINQLGHDLKTPLTPVLALLPLIEELQADEKAREMLAVVANNVAYMNELVDRTLQLARLNSESRALHTERVDLAGELGRIAEGLASHLASRQITLAWQAEDDLAVDVDRVQLRELVSNLLSNASRYMGGPGLIEITAARSGCEAMVSVRDTGIGMTPEQTAAIFDEFYKADRSRHDRTSLGLGLSICRRIAEVHGGRIWAESPGPGSGSTLTFALPLSGPC